MNNPSLATDTELQLKLRMKERRKMLKFLFGNKWKGKTIVCDVEDFNQNYGQFICRIEKYIPSKEIDDLSKNLIK